MDFKEFLKENDAAKRISDAVNMALVATKFECVNKWLACTLEDGSCDHTIYDTRTAAIYTVMPYEDLYLFIQIPMEGMTERAALSYLRTCRKIAKTPGIKLTDPEHVVNPMIFRRN
jgi:hypothetical protein